MESLGPARLVAVALLTGAVPLQAAVGAAPPSADPVLADHLTVIAPASPGGGWDQTARAMQHVLVQAGLVPAVDVSNSPGAGGVIGLAQFVTAERGRGDCLLVSGLAMVSALRTNHAAVSLAEATPIARLTGDYEVIAVPATSELRDFDDLVQALRVQPGAVSWAGGSGGGVDQILVSALARAIGVDPVHMDYVPFAGGGEVADALVSHEVSVGVSGYAELAPLVVAGRLRMLAISSAARLPGLDVPTLREQGVDVVLLNWRGIFAPPGITAEQKDRLESLVAAMVELPGWRMLWHRLASPVTSCHQAGELGFEPRFLASTSQGDDTGVDVQTFNLQAFTIHPAPIYIIAALG